MKRKVKPFKRAQDLTHEELVEMINGIQEILWFTDDPDNENAAVEALVPNPDKEEDEDTAEAVYGVLIAAGMKPEWEEELPPIQTRLPGELDKLELEQLVIQIREILWFDNREDRWNSDLEWNSETIEYVAGVLEDAGLKPEASP